MAGRLATYLRGRYATLRSHPAWRVLRPVLAVAVLAACAWFIWRQVSSSYATISLTDVDLSPGRLAVSWLCITAATALGAWEWVLLVRALGAELGTVPGMAVHLTANLGKYIPGAVWPYAGKAYLANRRGVPLRLAGASIGAEFAIVYLTGALLVLLCLPFSGLLAWPPAQRAALLAGALLLAALAILGLPGLGRWAGGRFGLWPQADWWRMALVMALVLLTWCLLGLGFGTLYGPFESDGGPQLLRHSLALAVALLLGQVAFFLPTGLGVREAVLVALLATAETAGTVVILAVVFRLLMIAGEIVSAAILAGMDRISCRRNPPEGG